MRPCPPLLIVGGFLVLALAIYWPGLSGPFLLDDFANVTNTTPATASTEELADVLVRNKSGPLRRPVAFLTFAGNHFLGGQEPFGYKLTNVLIHIVVGLLAFVMLRRLARLHELPAAGTLAAIAALIWLLHPLSVSTVLYVVQRMAQLAGLFSIAAVAIYLGWRQACDRPHAAGRRSIFSILLIWVFTALAILSKESGALIPLLILVTEWSLARVPDRRLVPVLTAVMPLVLAMAGFLLVADRLLDYGHRDFSLTDRIATQGVALWYYLGLIIWPRLGEMGLFHDDFPVFGIGAATAWVALGGWLACIVGAGLLRRRAPWLAFGVTWFLAAHAMESTILPLELVFEHRNYIAMLGPIYAIVAAGARAGSRFESRVPAVLAFIGVICLSGMTYLRASAWSSFETFALVQANNHPGSTRAQLHALQVDTAAGRLDHATARIRFIHAREPDQAWPYLLDLNIACTTRVDPTLFEAARVAFSTRPRTADLLNGLRSLVRRKNNGTCPGLSVDEIRDLLEAAGQNPVLHEPMASQRLLILQARLAQHEDPAAAVRALKTAIEVYPENHVAALQLAYLYLNNNQLEEARSMIPVLRRIDADSERPIGYLIDELEDYIQQATKAQAVTGEGR